MPIDLITSRLLTQTLQAYQQAQDPPPEMLELHLLGDAASLVERRIRLHEWLCEQVAEHIKQYRRAEGMALTPDAEPTHQLLLESLAADFHKDSPDLRVWSAVYHRYLAPLTLPVSELARAAGTVERQFRRYVDEGVDRLTDVLRRSEIEAQRAARAHGAHLPPPDFSHLFGVDEVVSRVALYLTTENHSPLISIEGLGGIGKTAIARAVAQRLAEHADFAEVIWLSARHEQMTDRGEILLVPDSVRSLNEIVTRLAQLLGLDRLAGLSTHDKLTGLHALLSKRAYLIVIDNLETVADVELLIPELRRLAERTRFLVTSRTTLRHFPYVQVVGVPELSLTHSESLIASELLRRNRVDHLTAAEMRQLYELIGGLPLALKLTTAQLGHLPLSAVLENLEQLQQRTPAALYTYIYRRTWQLLDEAARELLLAMLLISPDGESADWLRGLSALPAGEFDQALTQLLDYSLVEVIGRLSDPRYHLHRLTITFLRTDLMQQWEE